MKANWIRFWSLLQKEERPQIKWVCRVLETTIMDIFATNEWNFSNRIQF
jgi:hypothetical protein